MDSSVHQVPQDDGASMTVAGLGLDTAWGTSGPNGQDAGSNILYIAVGYVKDEDYKLESDPNLSQDQATSFADFEDHVSPLDPNMSSVARYSPVYTADAATYGNPVVVTQLVTDGTGDQSDTNFVGNLGGPVVEMGNTDLQQTVEGAQYLHMVNDQSAGIIENASNGALSMIPDGEQEVELLITDQTTGISYSVSTQEYLVERCLADDQQLLEALAPDPLLDADLLSLDENTLKSQLSEIVIDTNHGVPQVNPQSALISNQDPIPRAVKCERDDDYEYLSESLRRSQRQLEFVNCVDTEDQLLNCVQAITDKPVPTRARATLPESHLVIQKKNDEYSVFAKKLITKATQFGPLEGKYTAPTVVKIEEGKLELNIQNEAGEIYRLDISDENLANWMCFVKKAKTYEEQNLVIIQQGEHLYYVSTRNIQPKQELLVGYSTSYANKYSLPRLEQPAEERLPWNCFECNMRFETSRELQSHLNIHDDERDENMKPKKRLLKRRLLFKSRPKSSPLECIACATCFHYPEISVLKKHMISHGIDGDASINDHFKCAETLKCEDCNLSFEYEDEYIAHNKQHEQENSENHNCSQCTENFSTEKQLDAHKAEAHAKVEKKPLRCPACYKIFASQDRMRRHMVIHASEDSKPYQCTKCSKRFLSSSALACHEKSHLIGRKVFECPICRERFVHVLQLKQHTHKHCIDNKFTCPYCNKVFLKYSIIRKHIRAFHCEKKHYCSECTKTFPTLDKLKMHLLKHSDHREFLCADCGKQFKRRDKLNEHCRRMHTEERENAVPAAVRQQDAQNSKKFTPKVQPTDYHRFIYKCHTCLVGFKRRGMLVNHLAKRHPEISPETVPELNLPILRTTRDYYCQYCDKIYKSSSKRKAHILKIHPGLELPMSNRKLGSQTDNSSLPNPTFSQTVGSVTTHPQSCQWCHKQYASKAKLLQHQRKKHADILKLRDNSFLFEDLPSRYSKNDGSKKQEEHAQFKRSTKVTDLLTEMVNIEQERDDGQYYHIVPVTSSDGTLPQGDFGGSDSRLYRLLTTGSNMPPPR